MSTAALKTVADVEKDTDLPRALVKKIVKNKVNQTLASSGAGEPLKDIQINKDALLAFSESAKVFVSYLTSAANDICKEAKRQTISAEDVFTALQDLDFGELVPPTKDALEAFRQESREKSKRKAEQVKKRKAEEAVRHQTYEGADHDIGDGLQEGVPADAGIAAEPVAAAKEHYPQPQQSQAPYIAKAHPTYSEPQKLPQPTAGQYQQAAALPVQQQQGGAFQPGFNQANPFGPAFAQASQFAAALAQAQAAQAAQAQAQAHAQVQASQLLPSHFPPAPLQNPGFAQLASSQASQPGGFTVPGHLNQANYEQFAALIAQQAARQRQAQEAQLAQAQSQIAQQQGNPPAQFFQQVPAQQPIQQPHVQPQQPPSHSQQEAADGTQPVTETAPTAESIAGSGPPGSAAAFQ